jgi:hypothetical protein
MPKHCLTTPGYAWGAGERPNTGEMLAMPASKSSSLKPSICEAIAEHSDIASQALCDQWNQVVLQPFSKLETNSLQSPLLIVIDALDECKGEDNTVNPGYNEPRCNDIRLFTIRFV